MVNQGKQEEPRLSPGKELDGKKFRRIARQSSPTDAPEKLTVKIYGR